MVPVGQEEEGKTNCISIFVESSKESGEKEIICLFFLKEYSIFSMSLELIRNKLFNELTILKYEASLK